MEMTTVTYPEAIEAIKAADLNNSQESAAVRLMNAAKYNTQSSIAGDEPKYDVRIEAGYGSHASFFCAGEGRIYETTLSVVLGPRGGKNILSAKSFFAGSGNKSVFRM
jgi:hypothetical protein